MLPILEQSSAGGFLSNLGNIGNSAGNIFNNAVEFKNNSLEGIEAIGEFCKTVMNICDWFVTIIKNPIIILTFVDQISIIVIIALLVLKVVGFKDLDKWITITIIIKVVCMAFL